VKLKIYLDWEVLMAGLGGKLRMLAIWLHRKAIYEPTINNAIAQAQWNKVIQEELEARNLGTPTLCQRCQKAMRDTAK
jgi:hypothetical protein